PQLLVGWQMVAGALPDVLQGGRRGGRAGRLPRPLAASAAPAPAASFGRSWGDLRRWCEPAGKRGSGFLFVSPVVAASKSAIAAVHQLAPRPRFGRLSHVLSRFSALFGRPRRLSSPFPISLDVLMTLDFPVFDDTG